MAPLHPVRFELIPFSSSSVKTVQKKGVGKQYSMQKSDGLGGRFFFFLWLKCELLDHFTTYQK